MKKKKEQVMGFDYILWLLINNVLSDKFTNHQFRLIVYFWILSVVRVLT